LSVPVPGRVAFAIAWIAVVWTPASGRPGEAVTSGGRTLVVATKESPPFAFKKKDGSWTGISVELWEHLARRLSLKYQYRELPLDAMLAGVEAGRVDAAVAAISVTAEREGRVDFSHPYFSTGLGIAVPYRGQRGFWGTLGRLFSGGFFTIVLGLVLATIAAGILFWLFERRENQSRFGGKLRRGLREGIWWSIVILLGHKGVTPVSTTARILAAGGMVASLLALSTLTGAIASILTLGQLDTSIQHPDDLRHVRVITGAGSTSAEYLRARRIPFQEAPDLDAALRRVAGGTSDAVLYDAGMLKHVVHQKHKADLQVLPWTVQDQEYAVALTSGSPLREPINQALLKFRDGEEWKGILFRFLGE
jgi:ABC-type amino acid transport substrate-binding protein